MKDDLVVVTVLGRDRPGLVAGITRKIADIDANIVDIEQNVIRDLFSMFMLVDLGGSHMKYAEFSESQKKLAKKLNIGITTTPYSEYTGETQSRKHELQNVTIMGKDKPGIVSKISQTMYAEGVNIERIKMIARGDLLVMEMLADLNKNADATRMRDSLRRAGEEIGVDVVVQPESSTHFRKRLIVFDMDSTIVDAEIIDELAKIAGVGRQVADITTRGMEGKLDFQESLRKRVRLLKGLPVSALEEIKNNMKLTPGSEELLRALKGMGFKLALISGGFTYFTDELQNRLGFDYAYANTLVIKDGKLTGEVSGEIIDSEMKAKMVGDIMKKENISKEEVVAVGDGANDRIMLKNAGLGIAFNAKEVLRKVADGSITKNNLKGLIYCLGVDEKHLEKT